jgi:hypothetical protein
MQPTLESFVRTLQDDGIAAGKAAGEKIRREAELTAEKIITEARQTAATILENARAKQKEEADQQAQELQLAARDAMLELHQRICRAVERVIDADAASILNDDAHLVRFIEQVVAAFAGAEAAHPDETIVFRVSSDDARAIVQRALAKTVRRDEPDHAPVFHSETGLLDLGFEYRHGGSAVEVTPGSLVTLLSPLVSEEVAARIRR